METRRALAVFVAAFDIARRRLEPAVFDCSSTCRCGSRDRGLDLLPGTCGQLFTVPVPDPRMGAAARDTARVAVLDDSRRLADVRTQRDKGWNKVSGLIQDERPTAPNETEHHPVLHGPARGGSDRDRHRIAPRAGERPAQHLGDRVRKRKAVQVMLVDESTCRCRRAGGVTGRCARCCSSHHRRANHNDHDNSP
jgi:hypothetical protein